MTYANVVVGTDGSSRAEQAVRHAGELAAAFGARLTVVTAFEHDSHTARLQEDAPEELRWRLTDGNIAEERARAGRDVARAAGATDVDVRVEEAGPGEALVDAARAVSADLIVVGSKGMTSASRFLLGSVPNHVSHHAPCDVIIVHTGP